MVSAHTNVTESHKVSSQGWGLMQSVDKVKFFKGFILEVNLGQKEITSGAKNDPYLYWHVCKCSVY